MCVECDDKITRRSFLAGATTVFAGAMLSSQVAGQQSPFKEVLDDPNIIKENITYKSGDANIRGYMARPKRQGGIAPLLSLTAIPECRTIFNTRRHF